MPRILILYATVKNQSARIAERIAGTLWARGHDVELRRVVAGTVDPGFAAYDGAIVGASIHYGRHPGHLRALVREHCTALAERAGAFFSVSLSAGGPGAKPEAGVRAARGATA